MRYFRAVAIGAAILALALAATVTREPGLTTRVEAGQLVYELACPGGTTPIFAGGFQTYDPQTSQFRSLACVNPSNGQVQILPQNLGTGTAAAGKYVDGASGAWTALPVATVEAALTGYLSSNFGGTAEIHAWVWPSTHKITRLTVNTDTVGLTCSVLPQVNIVDQTTTTTLATVTLATGAATLQADSGALSINTTAGHTFTLNISQAATCSLGTFNNPHVTVIFQ